jgi:hypothetical protein
LSILFYNYLPRKRIDLFASFAQNNQSMVPVEDGPVGARFERAGLAWEE